MLEMPIHRHQEVQILRLDSGHLPVFLTRKFLAGRVSGNNPVRA